MQGENGELLVPSVTVEATTLPPHPPAPAPVAEDPIVLLQSQLRDDACRNAYEALSRLLPMVHPAPAAAAGASARTAARALRLIQDTASHYIDLLAALGGTPPRKVGRRAGSGMYTLAAAQGLGNVLSDDEDAGELSPGGETMANKALQQVLAVAKSFATKKPEPIALPSFSGPPVSAHDIESLTRALSDAKHHGMPDVVKKLQESLDKALAIYTTRIETQPPVQPPLETEPAVPVPSEGAAFLAGVAGGMQAEMGDGGDGD